MVRRPDTSSGKAGPSPSNVPIAASSTQLDVQGSDAQFLAPLGNILGCQHSCVGRRLVSVGLHFHATSHTADGFPAKGKGDIEKKALPLSSPQTSFWLQTEPIFFYVLMFSFYWINKLPIQ